MVQGPVDPVTTGSLSEVAVIHGQPHAPHALSSPKPMQTQTWSRGHTARHTATCSLSRAQWLRVRGPSVLSPAHLSTCPPIHLSTGPSVHLSTGPSVCLPTWPSIRLATCPLVHLSPWPPAAVGQAADTSGYRCHVSRCGWVQPICLRSPLVTVTGPHMEPQEGHKVTRTRPLGPQASPSPCLPHRPLSPRSQGLLLPREPLLWGGAWSLDPAESPLLPGSAWSSPCGTRCPRRRTR